jgi:hypothetical protein
MSRRHDQLEEAADEGRTGKYEYSKLEAVCEPNLPTRRHDGARLPRHIRGTRTRTLVTRRFDRSTHQPHFLTHCPENKPRPRVGSATPSIMAGPGVGHPRKGTTGSRHNRTRVIAAEADVLRPINCRRMMGIMTGVRTFEPRRFYRFQALGMFSLFAVVAVWLVAMVATGAKNGPPVLFVAFWVLAAVWNGYWFLFRICYRISLEEASLRWDAPAAHGVVALDALRDVRPSRLGPTVAVIRADGSRPILVWQTKGFRDLLQAMQAQAPQLATTDNWYSRLVERLPGRNGFNP